MLKAPESPMSFCLMELRIGQLHCVFLLRGVSSAITLVLTTRFNVPTSRPTKSERTPAQVTSFARKALLQQQSLDKLPT